VPVWFRDRGVRGGGVTIRRKTLFYFEWGRDGRLRVGVRLVGAKLVDSWMITRWIGDAKLFDVKVGKSYTPLDCAKTASYFV
jgi:hypothetical protein